MQSSENPEPSEGSKPEPSYRLIKQEPVPLDRPVDDAAIELAKARVVPRPPGKKISFDEAQQWFALLTPEMWHHVVVYLYRRHPKLIRKLKNPDNPAYIDCMSQTPDQNYMIQNHGGGKYNMMVVDSEIRGKENKLFECDFDVDANQHAPKLNYEELDINAKENMAYVGQLQFKGILDNRGIIMQPQPNAAAAGASEAMLKTILEYTSKMSEDQRELFKEKIAGSDQQALSKSIGDLLLEKMKQDDPNKQSTVMLGLMKEVLAARPSDGITAKDILQLTAARPSESITMKDILQITNEQNKTFLLMFEKLSEHRAEPQSNPQITQFKEIMDVAKDLAAGFSRGGAAAGARNGWEVGLDYAKELGVPLLNMVQNFMTLRNGGRGIPMPPVTPNGAQPSGAFDPYRDPAAMRALANSMAQAPQPPAQPAAPPAPVNELAALMQQYGGLILNNLNMGTTGWAFADWLVQGFGNATHAQICAQGEPALVAALLAVPEIAIFGEPRLRKFVHEFVNFQEFLDAEDAGEEEDDSAGPVDAEHWPKETRAGAPAR